jgi:2-hydroxychromene-2-carboxylate isomerase
MNADAGAGPGPERELAFWFDFASTYSYIAAMRIEALCEREHVTLRWVPFLLGPIFQLQGWNDSPFNINKLRGDYMWTDIARLAVKYDLPWVRPTKFPRASTLAARVACSIAEESWCGDFVRSIFIANFGADRDIGDPAVIADVISQLGRPAAEVLDRACDEDHRGLLRANTDRAIKIGIFGAPNCVVNGELFWGEETLEDAIAWVNSDVASS